MKFEHHVPGVKFLLPDLKRQILIVKSTVNRDILIIKCQALITKCYTSNFYYRALNIKFWLINIKRTISFHLINTKFWLLTFNLANFDNQYKCQILLVIICQIYYEITNTKFQFSHVKYQILTINFQILLAIQMLGCDY